jgi:hypothetical protein
MKLTLAIITISLASCANTPKPQPKYDKTILLVVKSEPSITGLLIKTIKLIIP